MKPGILIILYFVLAFFYLGQAFLFGENNAIGRPALMVILAVNLYYMARSLRLPDKPLILTAIVCFVLLNLGYYLWGDTFIMNVPTAKSFQIFKTVLLSTTCIFPTYYWTRQGYSLRVPALIFAAAYCAIIYMSRYGRIEDIDKVDNMGYYYLNFIPFLFLIRGRAIVKIGLCLLLNVLIIACAKRGAIISAGVADIIFFLYIWKDRQISRGFFSRLCILALVAGAAYFAAEKIQSNTFVQNRFTELEQGNSSGRDRIYRNLWVNWTERYDVVQQTFGGGYCMSPRINDGVFAHNDWLELLTDLGLAGVAAYLLVIIGMIEPVRRARNVTLRYAMLTITAIWLLKTMFSMSYLDENSFILMLLFGMLAAKSQTYETETPALGQYA